jgi:hypothetical protein
MTRHRPAPPPDRTQHGAELPPVVVEFNQRLRKLPLGAWADAAVQNEEPGRVEPPAAGEQLPPTEAARARLRQIADDMPSVVTQTRRYVHDLVGVAECFVEPEVVARMKKTALTAALALVARPALGEEDFARLYAPFADFIPPNGLGVGGEPGALDRA